MADHLQAFRDAKQPAAMLLVTTDCIGIPEVGMEGPVLRAVTAR